ncbi:MAG: glycogen debranching enzyme N-terminal domain-containing protein [Lentisphaerae bacterium]|nr:glycogen debranching enzyme N-terminal domain-containing protein [Lentisphaerota bacterium]
MTTLHQEPAPGTHHVRHAGDVLELVFTLSDRRGGKAWVRTNLGGATVRREEIIGLVRHGDPIRHRDWHDYPMTRVDDHTFRISLPLTDVGRFEAKAFFLEPGSDEPLWPPGENTVVKVEPADTVCANTLYTAFVRQFGPNRERATATADIESAVRALDAQDYTVIPRSGTFRELIAQLDFILGTLGFRVLQLLPIHPVPTTYARMGRFGSPFAALDYWSVDPALAEFDRRTTPLHQFGELIDAVHARGAKLFMDMPINHTGWASRLQVQHPEWFARNADATFTSPGAWGVTWEDLSKLDFQHRGLWTYMAEVFLHWCRQGVDGFRCDAGYMIPGPVWEYIVAEVRAQFPDTVFLLEGLGGPAVTVDGLLTVSNLNWAYSELFQKFGREEIESCILEAAEQASSRGLYVHYAETHDNSRLAAHSAAWADMRTALAALCAPAGAFGITAGVEWHATVKVDVHGAAPLAWGNASNQVARLQRLGALLHRHPAFAVGARLRVMGGNTGAALVLCREPETHADPVLILINLDDHQPATATWSADCFPGGGTLVDLLSGSPIAVETRDGRHVHRLAPAEALCLTADAGWLARLADSPAPSRRAGSEAARSVRQRQRAKVLELHRARQGGGDATSLDLERLADSLARDPLRFMEELCGESPAPVVMWTWPQDQHRTVMVPPGHALMIRADADFSADVRAGGRVLYRARALPGAEGLYAALVPSREDPDAAQSVDLDLTVFCASGVVRTSVPLVYLAPLERALVRTRCPAHDAQACGAYAICANHIGTFAQVRAAWGSVRSQYDALLAGNLHPDYPVDRRVMFTRCRAWLVFRGYSHPLDERCLDWFGQGSDGAVTWRFLVPAGLGKLVPMAVTLRLAQDRNVARLAFRRLPSASPDHLADDRPVRLILRPDIEDRTSHEKTKAFLGPEHAWPPAVRAAADGFVFTPAPGRALHVQLPGGTFTPAPEWSYMVAHPEESERGLDGSSDLFSPGYFSATLSGAHALQVQAGIVTDGAAPEFVNAAEPSAIRGGKPVSLRTATFDTLRDFVVRRGQGCTVIAGYPWFLDWGRDTMICLRGLIAGGLLDESKAILGEFARFEQQGTLPNVIHGADATNRDTSDAPLWFFTACADVLAADGHAGFLNTDVGGRTVRDVMRSIARGYMAGTANGIRMDAESGLIFSPSHFTWMDTNYPAGTPREGYPVEIQALWHAALRLLSAHDRSGAWRDLAGRVAESLLRYYPREGGAGLQHGRYLSDCLHARPGQSAAEAVADDALRPNQLLAITLGAVQDPALAADILRACEALLVPGALRSLADRPVERPIPVVRDGRALNDPQRPYWGQYTGDEDTRRKPAYHNGTAWTWLFPSYSEALVTVFGERLRARAAALLGSAALIINRDCLRHVPEVLDGDAPHRGRGCGAQAWGCTELHRVLVLLSRETSARDATG